MSRDQPRDIRLVNRDPYIGLLVGGFNPSERYDKSNSKMFPSFLGVNIKQYSKPPLSLSKSLYNSTFFEIEP